MIGLIGEKCGMMRIFTPSGEGLPATIISVEPNRIVQIKEAAKDGYRAIQVTYGDKKAVRLASGLAGHYAKAKVATGKALCEFRLADVEGKDFKIGDALTVEIFKTGQIVDVQGVTKGKGFAGVTKRHHFKCGMASHGNSLSHRTPGSIGQRQTPGRVFKGKPMPGHLGNDCRTVQNQEVILVDTGRNLLAIKGAIPGCVGGQVIIKPAVKTKIKGGRHAN